MDSNELISYAMDFSSYLISKLSGINQIILYGSGARGDFHKESDIDLFVDTNEELAKKVEKVIDEYYHTSKFKGWKLKGIENEISCVVGELDSDEWRDLKRSIISSGIVLYGRYKAEIEKVNQYLLISFENIKPDSKRVLVFRKMFGFRQGNRKYPGIVEGSGAIKIGKGSLLVRIENSKQILDYFKEKKISIKVYDIWSDVRF